MDRERGDLEREATHLHRLLIGSDPPKVVVDQYILAEGAFLSGSDRPCILRLFELGADVEALEFFLRVTGRRNELTRKLGTICFLCEAKSVYLSQFVTFTDSGPISVVFSLIWATLRSGLKFFKGMGQARKFDLV